MVKFIPEMKTSFFCCSLKTGAQIIGWLSLICGVILSVVGAIALSSVMNDLPCNSGQDGSDPTINEAPEGSPEDHDFQMVLALVFVVSVFISTASAICFLIGIYKNKPGLLIPYIFLSLLGLVYFTHKHLIPAVVNYDYLSILSFVFQLYCFAVVYNFFKELKGESPESANQKPFPYHNGFA